MTNYRARQRAMSVKQFQIEDLYHLNCPEKRTQSKSSLLKHKKEKVASVQVEFPAKDVEFFSRPQHLAAC